jgi:hypothetical protein
MSQSTFFFDAPLTEMPVSQIPPKPVIPASIPTECEAFVRAALVVLEAIADGFDTDDVLDIMGVPKLALVGWHRSRVLEAIKQPSDNPYGNMASIRCIATAPTSGIAVCSHMSRVAAMKVGNV